MKKFNIITLTVIIVLMFTGLFMTKTNASYTEELPTTYVNYAFAIGDGEYKIVTIFVPENIEYVEYLYMVGELSPNSYEFRLVHLNTLLIKRGLDPIYY